MCDTLVRDSDIIISFAGSAVHAHYARFQLSLCRGPRLLQVPCLIAPLAYSNSLEGDSTPWCVPALSPCFPVGWDRGTSGTGAKVDVSFDGLLCIPPFLRLLIIDGLAACLWVGPRHRWLRLRNYHWECVRFPLALGITVVAERSTFCSRSSPSSSAHALGRISHATRS